MRPLSASATHVFCSTINLMNARIPETMKAAVAEHSGPPEVLKIKDVPVPHVKRGHVLIALDYASLGSWDAAQRSGAWGEVKPGTILGADGSGKVAAVASDVTRVHVGDRVYSYSYENPDGGFHAEYVSVPADRVERVPEQLDQKVAGAIPCVALTAHSGILTLKLKDGQTLLVYGASGGVGSLAVWLAAHATGATVTGTARADAQEYVRHLGAERAIDPQASEIPDGFDAALVTANGPELRRFLEQLRPRAPLAYPNGVEPEPQGDGHPTSGFDGEMSHSAFERLNKAIGSQTIPLRIQEFSLNDAADAHRRIEQGHVVGKIVLRIQA